MKNTPEPNYLHKRLNYNPITGDLIWNAKKGNDRFIRAWNKHYANTNAGTKHLDNHIVIGLNHKLYEIARIIWKMTYAEDSIFLIDHINRNPFDNRLLNLREATNAQNSWNTKISSNNSSGIKGVNWNINKQKWGARIGIKGKMVYLGDYNTRQEAIEARLRSELKIQGEFSINYKV